MSVRATQFVGVKLIEGDCSHWHYKMFIPIKDDIQKLFAFSPVMSREPIVADRALWMGHFLK